jgi:hypothetical protein
MATPQGLAYTLLSRATSRSGIKVFEMTRMKTECIFKVPSSGGNHLYVAHLDIISLNKHYYDIINDPALQQMAIVCLKETRMKKKHTSRNNFLCIKWSLTTKHGLAIFVKQDL